jgi:hypothetical protein
MRPVGVVEVLAHHDHQCRWFQTRVRPRETAANLAREAPPEPAGEWRGGLISVT